MEAMKRERGVAKNQQTGAFGYNEAKYSAWVYGSGQLCQLAENRHGRGLEGASLVFVKAKAAPGKEFLFRKRGVDGCAVQRVSGSEYDRFYYYAAEQLHGADFAVRCVSFAYDLDMGHLRFLTTGKSGLSCVRPSGNHPLGGWSGRARLRPSLSASEASNS